MRIALLLYPDVASATVRGLTELFTVASTLARGRIGVNAPMLRVKPLAISASQWMIEKGSRCTPDDGDLGLSRLIRGNCDPMLNLTVRDPVR
jgi:hypothetical protein